MPETVALAEDFAKLRHRFLTAVFFISSKKDDVFPFCLTGRLIAYEEIICPNGSERGS